MPSRDFCTLPHYKFQGHLKKTKNKRRGNWIPLWNDMLKTCTRVVYVQ